MAAQLTHQEFYIPGTQLHSTPNHKAIIECNICSAIKMQLPTLASANKMFCFGQWLFITVDWVERLLENGSIFLFYILALKAIPYFLLCWLGRSWKQQWKYDCETEHIVRYFLSCLLTDCCFQSCIFIVLNVTYTNTLPACSPSLPGITHKQLVWNSVHNKAEFKTKIREVEIISVSKAQCAAVSMQFILSQ